MFTEKQLSLIERCKKTGYGWRKFALSVEASGRCSPAQEETLISMVQRISGAEAQKLRRRSYTHDISDCEVMSFGLEL